MEFDSKTMRTTKPGLKRLFITLSVLASFLIGLPFLWKSVEIYRSDLPFREIDSLVSELETLPLQFPCTFHAIFVRYKSRRPDDLRSEILYRLPELKSNTGKCGICNFSLSVTVNDVDGYCDQSVVHPTPSCSNLCGSIRSIDFNGDADESIDESLKNVLGGCSGFIGKIYTVVVVNGSNYGELRTVVGKHSHAWITGRSLVEEEITAHVAEVFVKVFGNGGREEGTIQGEFMPVGSDGRIVLSFNLLNSDPRNWFYDWEFPDIDKNLLSPVLRALNPIANITVESQVLYHTPKASFSYWSDKLRSNIFRTSDLPFFVNSNEWHLDTSIAAGGRSKILQFVVYIPSEKECPLLLQLPRGEISKTNGFISPTWGGVIVWNPKSCLKVHPYERKLSTEDLEKIFEVFLGQFRQLLGLRSNDVYIGLSDAFKLLPSGNGFTEWELDFLSRQHTCFNLQSCATTLGSLSRLVQSLPRMIIMEEIGRQVKFSLEAAKIAKAGASLGDYARSAGSSREARSLAEGAFYHPSMMSVSYFSFEHCFAVYSPFFLPVAMHVVMATLREWKRYKHENAKYLAWKATKAKTA